MFGLLLESQLWGCAGLAGKHGAMQHPCASKSQSQTIGVTACDGDKSERAGTAGWYL